MNYFLVLAKSTTTLADLPDVMIAFSIMSRGNPKIIYELDNM